MRVTLAGKPHHYHHLLVLDPSSMYMLLQRGKVKIIPGSVDMADDMQRHESMVS